MIEILVSKTKDYCAVCGHEIQKGHIFIMARIPCPIGREIWRACHLKCFAQIRQKDKQVQRRALMTQ